MNPTAPTSEISNCPANTSCQPGTDGIASTSCKQDETCKPICSPKKGLSAGDIAAIILGLLLLAAIIWIIYSLLRKCPGGGVKCRGECYAGYDPNNKNDLHLLFERLKMAGKLGDSPAVITAPIRTVG